MLLLLGCVPLPYLLPPTDFSAQIDPIPVVRTLNGRDVPVGPTAIDLRAGIVPLSVVPELANRKFDPSVGFVASFREPSGRSSIDLGGYGRVAYRAWTDSLSGSSFVAVEPRGTIDIVSIAVDDQTDALALGIMAGVALRIGGRCDTGPDGACFSGGWNTFGVAWGEWGFALALDLGVEARETGNEGRLLLGLELRVPAGAGVVLVPIY